MATYTAHRIANTENGWRLTNNETGKQNFVFCRLDANTAEDAVAVLESVGQVTEEAES